MMHTHSLHIQVYGEWECGWFHPIPRGVLVQNSDYLSLLSLNVRSLQKN